MSNASSNTVSLQADVSRMPTTTLGALGSFRPLLKALSADNVDPSAVLEIEALGSFFHFNGALAKRVPDILKRSNSEIIERLQVYVGWMAGDTASHMAASAGGQSAAVLSWALEEIYDNKCGEILYELSSRLLTRQQQISGVSQFTRVAQVISRKMATLGWGTHLAYHATRIRQVYLNSDFPEMPRTLVNEPSRQSMTDFLAQLHIALEDECTILHVEGCHGAAIFVAILMALCPDDVYIQVENEIIFQGTRRSVLVSISANGPSKVATELVLHDSGHNIQHFPLVSKRSFPARFGRMKFEGCLAVTLDNAFLTLGMECPQCIRTTCADLIVSLVFSGKPDGKKWDLPKNGLAGLLGPLAKSRVHETLVKVFRTEPTYTSSTTKEIYKKLRSLASECLSAKFCTCPSELGKCLSKLLFTRNGGGFFRYPDSCPVDFVLTVIGSVIATGIATIFVDESDNTVISRGCDFYYPGPFHDWESEFSLIPKKPNLFDKEYWRRRPYPPSDWPMSLHCQILSLVATSDSGTIGIGDGGCCIFPCTLQNPRISDKLSLNYRLLDGEFHDGRNYYQSLYHKLDSEYPFRTGGPFNTSSWTPFSQIVPSDLGAHSGLVISARPTNDALEILIAIQMKGKEIKVGFLELHLNFISMNVARACSHNPTAPLDKKKTRLVVPTSAAAPIATGNLISIALTHKNPEAQFLSCGLRSALFQGNACLNCAVDEAVRENCKLIIQS